MENIESNCLSNIACYSTALIANFITRYKVLKAVAFGLEWTKLPKYGMFVMPPFQGEAVQETRNLPTLRYIPTD